MTFRNWLFGKDGPCSQESSGTVAEENTDKEEIVINTKDTQLSISVRTVKGQPGCSMFMDVVRQNGVPHETMFYAMCAKRVIVVARRLFDIDTPQNTFHIDDNMAESMIQELWNAGYRPDGVE